MTVPILSLQSTPPTVFADAFGDSFRTYGFAMVRDHGMDADLVRRGWEVARTLFAMPEDAKQRYILADGAGQRGYTPFGRETAKGGTRADLKEFWHIGRDGPASAEMPTNIWPTELPDFAPLFRALYAEFDRVGGQLLAAIARHLGLTADWFEDATRGGNSILRLLHYPPVPANPSGVRAGAHEDINLITLLLGAEEAGLQLLTRDGHWLDVDPPPGALVVNVGDMLQRLTNHILPSTSHRVVNPPPERADRARYSMPFFLHPRPDFLIEPLPQCVSAANPARHPPITAQAYLAERLAEIGLVGA